MIAADEVRVDLDGGHWGKKCCCVTRGALLDGLAAADFHGGDRRTLLAGNRQRRRPYSAFLESGKTNRRNPRRTRNSSFASKRFTQWNARRRPRVIEGLLKRCGVDVQVLDSGC
jgi:hypothetical protein